MRVLTAAILLASSAALSAQTATPQVPQRAPGTDRASATAVVIDVVVRDGKGRPVVDLTADDFEIYEDGVRQPLGSFRPPVAASEAAATTAAPRATAAAPASAPAAAKPAPREPAVMAFLFDRLTLEGRKLALDAVRKYVGTQAKTENIIGIFDVDLGLQILLPFTQDGEAIRNALAKVSASRPGRVDPGFTTDMRSLTDQGLVGGATGPKDNLSIADRELKSPIEAAIPGGPNGESGASTRLVTQTYGELQRNSTTTVSVTSSAAIIAGLSRAPGRKSLVLFTEGLAMSRNTDPYFYALIDQANRANVAIYTIDSVGLRAEDHVLMAGRLIHSNTTEVDGNLTTSRYDLTEAARGLPDVALTILADQTGGQMFAASNDLFRAFPRLDEDLRSYYSLTYAAPRAEPDLKFHKIVVKVKRPGLVAKTRSGYTSLPAATGAMPILAYEAPALARLDSTPLPNELPILARALVFPVAPDTAQVPVLVSVPTKVLDYARDEAAGTFAADAVVLIRIRDAEGQVVHKASEQYGLSGRLDGLEASRAGELLFYRQPQLAPGVYTFEAIVMDTTSGKASVRVSSLDVPRQVDDAPRLGTPFLVQRAEPVPAPQKDAANPLYFGDVLLYPNLGQPLSKAADKELAFGFVAYGGPGASLEASLELVRSGQTVATLPLPLAEADKQGRINQVSKLPLDPIPPGAYELRITVKAGAQQVTRGVRFAVVAGS
jgi:VWFA-related protein